VASVVASVVLDAEVVASVVLDAEVVSVAVSAPVVEVELALAESLAVASVSLGVPPHAARIPRVPAKVACLLQLPIRQF
jgi:hypothetical protein